MPCSIPGDPDIAGLGVRIAVYAQAVLCMLPPGVLSLFGPDLDSNYAEVVKTTYNEGRATVATMLVTNLALLAVSIYKVSAGSLTRYHAALILNLNWIVFLSALSSAITLAYSHPLRTKPGFRAWLRFVLAPITPRSAREASFEIYGGQSTARSLLQSRFRWSKVLRSERHLIFLSIHMFSIGIIGVILFSNLDQFGRHTGCQRDIVVWTFNVFLPISSTAIQHFWYAIYVLALVPAFNIIICATIILVIWGLPLWLALAVLRCMSKRSRLRQTVTRVVVVLPFLVVIALLIACIEETIHANRSTNAVGTEEGQWGFGQILAIVLLVPPAFETIYRIVVIFTDRPVIFPVFPAREADKAPDREQSVRAVATARRGELNNVNDNDALQKHKDIMQYDFDPLETGVLTAPVVKCSSRIQSVTPEQVLGVIVCPGMRKLWDSSLDFEGVLKRYMDGTVLRYAVTKPVRSASGVFTKRDLALVQQVERTHEGEIRVIHTSMDPKNPETKADYPHKQPDHWRAGLEFEGWVIKPHKNKKDVELTCRTRLSLEDTPSHVTAVEMVRRTYFYAEKVSWTVKQYGFPPVCKLPTQVGGVRTARGPVVLERENMDTEMGRYTAIFRTEQPGSVTVIYDACERREYYRGAHNFCRVIEGSAEDLKITDNLTGTLILEFGADSMVLELTVIRKRK